MAGHSKWANIKHKKARVDAKRGKMFTQFIREITVAARYGGADLESNPRLRDAVAKARAGNMKGDTIDRAIKRGAGLLDGTNYESVRYEGYGPGGVAVIVDCLTDNRNRTVADVRHAFSKAGGNLGTDGSVSYLFTKQGELHYESGVDEEKIMEHALEAGAEDIVTEDDGSVDVITTPETFMSVCNALDAAGMKPAESDVTMVASTEVDLDQDTAEKLLRMVDVLEELDDVQEVFTNASIADEIFARLNLE